MKRFTMLFAFALLLPVFCQAQDQGGGEDAGSDIKLAKEDDNHPCEPDMRKYCQEVYDADRMKQWNCLQANSARLSAPCKKELGLIVKSETKKAMQKEKRRPKSVIDDNHPCVDDRDEFCASVKGDQEKETKCLLARSGELTEGCRNRLRKDAKKTRKKPARPAQAPAESKAGGQ